MGKPDPALILQPRRRPAVFLDRDGVINATRMVDGKSYPPQTLDDLTVLPGVGPALAALRRAGFRTLVVTNQPDVAAGRQRRAVVDAINARLLGDLPLDAIHTCWCLEGVGCDCYKPAPGLILAAARDWGVDPTSSFMVGDRWRDIGAGKAAGCRTIFIDYGYSERRPDAPDHVVTDLAAAAAIILQERYCPTGGGGNER